MNLFGDVPAYKQPGNRYAAPVIPGWEHVGNSAEDTADEAAEIYAWPVLRVEPFDPDGNGFIKWAVYRKLP